MAQAGEQKIGYVRHDIDGSRAAHSVLLSPQFYGMGLGARVIRAADQEFIKLNNALRVIYAEIQDHHAASINAFAKAGYKLKERIVKNGKKAGVYQWQR
jgi:RimJ/RimL family protein N-acetyltransferase